MLQVVLQVLPQMLQVVQVLQMLQLLQVVLQMLQVVLQMLLQVLQGLMLLEPLPRTPARQLALKCKLRRQDRGMGVRSGPQKVHVISRLLPSVSTRRSRRA